MSAADQNLEITFQYIVQNERAIDDLRKQLAKVRAEIKKLNAANEGVAKSTDKVSKAMGKHTNVVDGVSKAARRNRQAMQQAGIQAGDFFTQISSGTGITQAFNQQIGQLGYAFSLIEPEGKKGATFLRGLGRFLAGPGSIAVLGFTMMLGPMIEKLLDGGDAANKLTGRLDKLGDITTGLTVAQDALGQMFDTTTGKIKDNSEAVRANLELKKVALRLAEAEARIATTDFLASGDARVTPGGFRRSQRFEGMNTRALTETGKLVTGILNETIKADEAVIKAQEIAGDNNEKLVEILERVKPALTAVSNAAGVKLIEAAVAAGELDSSLLRAGGSAKKAKDMFPELAAVTEHLAKIYKEGAIDAEEYSRRLSDALWQHEKAQILANAATATGAKKLKDYADAARDAAGAKERLNKQVKAFMDEFKDPIVELPLKPEDIEVVNIKIIAAKDLLTEMQQEMIKSFQTVGMAVANAFQGMLSGAQSWKDGMKGIIRAVIDELWRLYVVQQIVGLVVGALGSLTKTPTKAATGSTPFWGGPMANGGSVKAGTPYLVGEKGPEMFMPNQSGTIIPNHNMKGGGGTNMTVNVDARGSNDPAAVRAEVERGILEAAPIIVAASQKRTVETLRRPRLAGNAVR